MRTLKHLAFTLVLALGLGLGAWQLLHAQNPSSYVISYTTLSSAVNTSTTTFPLTSATARSGSSFGAPAAGQCGFVDQELVHITAISGSNATVTRDTLNPAPHKSGATIFTAPCDAFKTGDPPFGSGNVTCANEPTPWINVQTGNVWICGQQGSGEWSATNAVPITYNSVNPGY